MFSSRILLLGFGSVGQALAPLLMAHWSLSPDRIRALAADDEGLAVATSLGIALRKTAIVPGNLAAVLGEMLEPGDLLINVSVEVSSRALVEWCQAHGVCYLDTCVEPWPGGYRAAPGQSIEATTNHALRESLLALRAPGKPAAVIAHGANPGVISHLARAGLLEMAAQRQISVPEGPAYWARLSQALGIRVMQIAERDTQRPARGIDEGFVNTWSVEGFLSEAGQPAECGWGSHENVLPEGAQRHARGQRPGFYLPQNGPPLRVQSWVPEGGAQDAFLITHHEVLSLAELLTIPSAGTAENHPAYRPTVFYAYAPCEETRRSIRRWADSGCVPPAARRVLRDELVAGEDQLGLLFVFEGGAFWYGSTVSIQQARERSRFCNATSLQVAGGILGALDWMLANPRAGVVEAEDLPHRPLLDGALSCLGRVEGVWTDWQPAGRNGTIPSGALQFADFLV